MVSSLKWIALGLALAHCNSRSESVPPPSAAPAVQAASAPLEAAKVEASPRLRPPEVAFKEPQPWQSRKKNTPPIPPPDLAPETWRAFVNQNQPIQIKTPVWQALPPKESVELAMPAVSKYACVVTPLSVEADQNDFQTKLKGWVLTRTLLCSGDGWQSWTEYSHTTRVLPDGTREMQAVPVAMFREREADSTVRHTYVLLRSDKEVRDATTGPPRIVPGVAVDDD